MVSSWYRTLVCFFGRNTTTTTTSSTTTSSSSSSSSTSSSNSSTTSSSSNYFRYVSPTNVPFVLGMKEAYHQPPTRQSLSLIPASLSLISLPIPTHPIPSFPPSPTQPPFSLSRLPVPAPQHPPSRTGLACDAPDGSIRSGFAFGSGIKGGGMGATGVGSGSSPPPGKGEKLPHQGMPTNLMIMPPGGRGDG